MQLNSKGDGYWHTCNNVHNVQRRSYTMNSDHFDTKFRTCLLQNFLHTDRFWTKLVPIDRACWGLSIAANSVKNAPVWRKLWSKQVSNLVSKWSVCIVHARAGKIKIGLNFFIHNSAHIGRQNFISVSFCSWNWALSIGFEITLNGFLWRKLWPMEENLATFSSRFAWTFLHTVACMGYLLLQNCVIYFDKAARFQIFLVGSFGSL